MAKVFISLGSNLGDSESILLKAISEIEKKVGKVVSKSSLYRTEPWGFVAENDFVNAVIEVSSSANPPEILAELLAIEKDFGRERKLTSQYESRILDLDIISMGDLILETENLKIPHPFMHERAFVAVPLSEIAPTWVHPFLKQSIIEILAGLKDTQKVEKLNDNKNS